MRHRDTCHLQLQLQEMRRKQQVIPQSTSSTLLYFSPSSSSSSSSSQLSKLRSSSIITIMKCIIIAMILQSSIMMCNAYSSATPSFAAASISSASLSDSLHWPTHRLSKQGGQTFSIGSTQVPTILRILCFSPLIHLIFVLLLLRTELLCFQ
jgi:hypothetical protein